MPRYRQGSKVPINVYDGDRPLFQAHSVEDAEESVRLLNRGWQAEQVSRMHVDPTVPRSVPFDTFPAGSLAPPETPPGSPVSEIEPVGAQDPPESREGHTGLVVDLDETFAGAEGWCGLNCGWCGHWKKGQFTKDDVANWLRHHRNASISMNPGHTTTASTCPEPCGGIR